VQYKESIPVSHKQVRASAGLFDVSHMGQVEIHGDRKHRLNFLEGLCPSELHELKVGQMKLSSLTNERGGIIDDCIFTEKENHTFVVVNGACKFGDIKHLNAHMATYNSKHGTSLSLNYLEESRSLMALQGPKAAAVVSRLSGKDLSGLRFMSTTNFAVAGYPCWVSRCGYTGEDGFELSVPAEVAPQLMDALLAQPEVMPIGLAARDSLRLEAGLCLYGHDLNEDTTPVAAGLLFTIGKRRRADGGFLGYKTVIDEIKNKSYARKRVGLLVNDGAPARENSEILDEAGKVIGLVTSGSVSPTLGSKISMGYIDKAFGENGTKVSVRVRGKVGSAVVHKLPFVPTNYYTGGN